MLVVLTMTVGVLHLRSSGPVAPTAVDVGRAEALAAPAVAVPDLGAPAADVPVTKAAVSLADLVKEARAKQAATSTTKARPAPTTTVKRATTTTSTRPTTSTTTAVAGAAPVTTAATTTTVAAAPLAPIVEKVAPPVAAVTGTITRSDSGIASWFKAPEATCAHRTLPMGTSIKVTRLHNGATATCKVDDRGPTVETGRLIDLSLDTFEKLAPREAGLIDVKIEW